MANSPHDEALMREAMSAMDRLLDVVGADRAALLNDLAQSRPDLHAVVAELLSHAESTNPLFREPASAPDKHQALRPDARLGPYRIINLLGEGGMGEVWLARRDDGLYEGEVAIKTLHPYFAGGALRERFLREAKVLGRLAHSNIARLLDAGIHDGVVYLVLEYVRGQPIDFACDAAQLDIAGRLNIFLQLCAGIAHAHSSLVVHRDIKPANVLLTADGVAKLLDFGIANIFEPDSAGLPSDITRLTGRVFTPAYAAPEQILGEPITTAADVYSLGVLLYVLLAGVPPYDATGDAVRWENVVLKQEPPSLWRAVSARNTDELAGKRSTTVARLCRDLSGDLDVIVQKALKKRPNERYPTVASLADDIRRYLQGEPVLAQADSSWYRLRKFVRRNRLAVAASAAVVAALGIGLAMTWWQLQVAQAERRRAEEVKEFIASTFRAADPFFTGKKSMTTVELLALARQRIDQQLASQPESAVELLNIVGESQSNLDEQEAAKATFNKAIELAEGLKPRDELQIAEAQAWLASIAREEGDQASVVPLLDKAVPVLRKYQPRSGRLLSMALAEQAFVKYEEGDLDDAIALSHRSVDAANAALGPSHTETLIAKRNLAMFYVLAKSYDEAKPLADEVLRDAQSLTSSGERKAILIQAESLYGRLTLLDGSPPDVAVRHLENGIALATELLGPKSETHLPMLSLLKLAQSRTGDVKGMVETARRAYEMTDGGRNGSMMLTDLAASTLMARQFPEALEQSREAVVLGKKFDNSRGSLLPRAQASYVEGLVRSGRFAEAEKVLSELLPVAKESPNKADLSDTYNSIGLLRQFQFRWQESEQAFRESLALTSSQGMAQKVRSESMLGIGIAQLEMGDATAAEASLREADQLASRTFLALIPSRADMAMQLGRALLAQKKLDAARQALATADDYWRDYDADNDGAGEAAYWLGQGHLAAGAKPEARSALMRAIAILKDSSVLGHARLVEDARRTVARL